MTQLDKENSMEQRLATKAIPTLFLMYALPQIGSMLFVAFQSIVDGLIVGRLIGANALAAVNVVMPSYALITAVALIIGIGTQAQMSIHLGEKNYSGAKSDIINGLFGLLIFNLLATVCINIYPEELARWLGANDTIMPLALDYIQGVMPWLVCIGTVLFLDFILKGLGKPKLAITLFSSIVVFNIALSYSLVKFTGLSTFGVGLGTGISYAIGTLAYLCAIRHTYKSMSELANAKAQWSVRTFNRIAYNGSSEGLAEISVGISIFLYNITLMKYVGEKGVAAFSLVDIMMYVCASIIIGVSNGIIPIVSYLCGAKLFDRIKQTCRLAVTVNFIVGIVFIAMMYLYSGSIVEIFVGTQEPLVENLAINGSRLLSLTFIFSGFNIFAASYFTAFDKPGYSLIIAAFRGLLFLCAGIILLPLFLGVNGIWLAAPIAEVLTFVAAVYFLRKNTLIH